MNRRISLTRARVDALLAAAGRGLDEMTFEAENDSLDEKREFRDFRRKVLEASEILRRRYPRKDDLDD